LILSCIEANFLSKQTIETILPLPQFNEAKRWVSKKSTKASFSLSLSLFHHTSLSITISHTLSRTLTHSLLHTHTHFHTLILSNTLSFIKHTHIHTYCLLYSVILCYLSIYYTIIIYIFCIFFFFLSISLSHTLLSRSSRRLKKSLEEAPWRRGLILSLLHSDALSLPGSISSTFYVQLLRAQIPKA